MLDKLVAVMSSRSTYYVRDENDMVSNDAFGVPTQKSVKHYSDKAIQTLTNKTLDDATVKFADTDDITKDLFFSLGGATTDKTMTIESSQTVDRTLTLPDASDILIGKTTTDTLTNKTLTSPILTTPALGTPSSADLQNCVGVKHSVVINVADPGEAGSGHAAGYVLFRPSVNIKITKLYLIPGLAYIAAAAANNATVTVTNAAVGDVAELDIVTALGAGSLNDMGAVLNTDVVANTDVTIAVVVNGTANAPVQNIQIEYITR